VVFFNWIFGLFWQCGIFLFFILFINMLIMYELNWFFCR
jgi:hypothetical protein